MVSNTTPHVNRQLSAWVLSSLPSPLKGEGQGEVESTPENGATLCYYCLNMTKLNVLGIAGSPRKGGNTDILLAEFMKGAAAQGAVTTTLAVRDLRIKPCKHCDACLEKGVCKRHDDMKDVYAAFDEADVIVVTSPIEFTSVPSDLKAMIDRFQSRWARKYRLKVPPLDPPKPRKGFFISVGGRKREGIFDCMVTMMKAFFVILDIGYEGDLLHSGIDEKGAVLDHPDALKSAFDAGQRLVQGN